MTDDARDTESIKVRVSIVDLVVARFATTGLEILLLRRAAGMRCTGAWEIVHGKIENGGAAIDGDCRCFRGLRLLRALARPRRHSSASRASPAR